MRFLLFKIILFQFFTLCILNEYDAFSKVSQTPAESITLLLTIGEEKTVDLNFDANAGVNGISYGNPQIVTTTLVKIDEKRQLIFKPLKSGDTTVSVRDNDGTLKMIFYVRVTGSNLSRIVSEIRYLLRDIEGIQIKIVGSKIVVDGEVIVPAEYGRLLTVIQDKNYSDLVINLCTLSPLAMQVLAKKIKDDINAFAPNVTTRVVNGMIFLEGSTENLDEAKRAASIASLYLPDLRPGNPLERDPSVQRISPRSLIVNFIMVNPQPRPFSEKLIRVTAHFVELAKDYNKVFAFKWQPGFTSDPQISVGQNQSGSTSSSTALTFSATLSSLLPKLQTSQNAGFARVLNTGTIIVRNGQPAKMSDQTQYVYSQTGANGLMTSASASVGLVLAVTPSISENNILLDLELDQTDLVGKAPTSGGAPVTDSHKVTTKIFVKSKESAAVAGLDLSNIGTNFNKDDPASGSFSQGTDPLFNLLRSKSFSKKKSQFVIFVTPEILESASEGTEDLRKNFRVKVK